MSITPEQRRAQMARANWRCQLHMFQCMKVAHTVVAVPQVYHGSAILLFGADSNATAVELVAVCRPCAKKLALRAELRRKLLRGRRDQPEQQPEQLTMTNDDGRGEACE